MWQNLAWMAVAGALGALTRYGVATALHRLCGTVFPWGTLAVNGLGCFLFGLVWSATEERIANSSQVRLIVLTGYLGAFTTFSTYAFETSALIKETHWMLAIANGVAQNLLGVACVFLGLAASRWL